MFRGSQNNFTSRTKSSRPHFGFSVGKIVLGSTTVTMDRYLDLTLKNGKHSTNTRVVDLKV